MSTIEYTGWWWIPEKPDDAVPGTLKFTQEAGLHLNLQGSLGGIQDLGETVPLILGLVPNLRVTLVEASLVGTEIHSPGFDTTEYRVGIAYLGEHFESAEELRFSVLELQLTHMSDWIADRKVDWRASRPDDSTIRYEFSYEHRQPEAEPIEGGKVAIGYRTHTKHTPLSGELQVSSVVRFELGERLDIDSWHRHYLRPVVNLFSLALGQPVRLSDVSVFPEDSENRDGVQVVARHFVTEHPSGSALTPDKMLFSRRDMDITFGELLQRWLTVHRELEPILNLYFSVGQSPAMYLEHQFLSMVQALEGYHRSRFGGCELPTDKHARRLEAILGAVPEQYRDWLEKELSFSNELKLANRLKALVAIAGDVFTPWTPNSRKKASFVRKVVDTRNYLTHYPSGQSPRPLDAGKLFDLTEALSILMQALLLAELGFTPEKRAELFRRNQRYRWATTRAKGAH